MMRKLKLILIVLGLSVVVSGCKKEAPKQDSVQETPQQNAAPEISKQEPGSQEILASLDPRVRKASELAAKIEQDPENSEEVLARSDMDREGLDALMYEIARDPELTQQYRIARVIE